MLLRIVRQEILLKFWGNSSDLRLKSCEKILPLARARAHCWGTILTHFSTLFCLSLGVLLYWFESCALNNVKEKQISELPCRRKWLLFNRHLFKSTCFSFHIAPSVLSYWSGPQRSDQMSASGNRTSGVGRIVQCCANGWMWSRSWWPEPFARCAGCDQSAQEPG